MKHALDCSICQNKICINDLEEEVKPDCSNCKNYDNCKIVGKVCNLHEFDLMEEK